MSEVVDYYGSSQIRKRDADGNLKSATDDDSSPSAPAESVLAAARKDIVRLDVGGTRYKVSRDTLMRCEGSMLANLVSGKWKEGNGEGEIFIDRDGGRFKYILDYLRSDRVYLPDLSDRSALQDEFDYFGINADMSKIFLKDDFVTISELGEEIKVHEAAIEQKKKKIAAIQESYVLTMKFAKNAKAGRKGMKMRFNKDVDKEMLRECLLSRGLYVACYSGREPNDEMVTLCAIGVKEKLMAGQKNQNPNA